MQKINQKYIYSVVKKALDEDLKPIGDITTKLIKFDNTKIKAKIISRQKVLSLELISAKKLLNLLEKKPFLKPK